MSRAETIASFLAAHGFAAARAVPLAQDASFRRYLRLHGGPRPAVLMDSPPPEDVRPFLRVAAHLAGAGLSVPEVIAADPAQGLLLLEDFGDRLLSAADPEPAQFEAAAEALAAMQAAPAPPLPDWSPATMTAAALSPLFDWWWPAAFGAPPPDAAREEIGRALAETLAPLAEATPVFVHRDFFAGNLIWLPDRAGPRRIGVLDFQSAALGHPGYDLASLIEDARRDVPPSVAARAVARFLAARPTLDPGALRHALAVCAAQRHLRVAAQWVRLARRDGKPQYLVHGPRTWRLLDAALRHPANAPLARALDRWIPPAHRRNPPEAASAVA